MAIVAKKRASEYAFTPEGRASFAHVFEKSADLNGRMVYSLVLLFPKTEAMKAELKKLRDVFVKVAKKEFGEDLTGIVLKQFRDGDKPNEQGKIREEQKGHWILNLSSGEKGSQPGIVGPDGKRRITTPEEFYSGCWAKAQVLVKAFAHQSGKRGVSCYLVNIQKTKDDAAFVGGPRAEDVFDAVVGGEETPTETAFRLLGDSDLFG